MRVRMRADVSGTRNGVDWPKRGEVIDLPDDEAMAMCANKMAEPVIAEDEVEVAVASDDADAPVVEKRPRATKKAAAPKKGLTKASMTGEE